MAQDSIQRKALDYDATGDAHYDVASAFIKSMRGSDPDAAIYWLARMLEAGEDPRFIARRIVICASEDVGNADPQALLVAAAAVQAVEFVGLPECQLNLAQAVTYIATAPKSNAATLAIGKARTTSHPAARSACPHHLRDAHYKGARAVRPRHRTTSTATTTRAAGSIRSICPRSAAITSRSIAATRRRSRSGWKRSEKAATQQSERVPPSPPALSRRDDGWPASLAATFRPRRLPVEAVRWPQAIAQAPIGAEHDSPGQRPGENALAIAQALKGRHNFQPRRCVALSGLFA